MKNRSPDPSVYSSWRDKIAYVIGLLGKEVTYSVINCVIFLYCFQIMHLSISFLGVLYLTSAIIGVCVSPLIGMLLDNTNSRYGKYKIWIVISSFFCLLALGGFYFLPQLGDNAQEHLFYISCIYTLWTLSYCILDLPGWAILSTFNTNNTTRDIMAQVPNFNYHIGIKIMIFVAIPILYHRHALFVLTASTYSHLIIGCALLFGFSQLFMVFMMGHNHKQNSNRQIRPISPLSTQFIHHRATLEGSNAVTGNVSLSITDSAPDANTPHTSVATEPANAASSSLASVPSDVLWPKQQQQCQQLSPPPRTKSFKLLTRLNKILRRLTFTQPQPQPLLNEAIELDVATINAMAREAAINDTVNHADSDCQISEHYPTSRQEQRYAKAYYYQTPTAHQTANSSVANSPAASISATSGARVENSALNLNNAALNRSAPNAILANDTVAIAATTTALPVPTTLANDSSHAKRYDFASANSARKHKTGNNILSLRTNIQVLLQNDQLLVVFLSSIMLYTIYGLIFGGIFACFVLQQVFLSPYIYAILVIGLLLHLGAISSFELLSRRFSNQTIFNTSLLLMLVGFSLVLLEQNISTKFLIPLLSTCYFLVSFGVGLNKVALTSMTIDTVDYGEFKLSVRSDGLVFALRAVAHHISKIIIFFYYSNALLLFFDHTPKAYPPESLDIILNINLAITLVIILLVLSFLIYSNLYKLNGAFYRNVLNNLQFLKHNQHWHSHAPTTSRFMLRYALDESTMIIKLKARNINDLVKAMVQKLSDVQAITSEHDYMVDLTKRLRQGDCGIAEGIALPHAKSSAVRRATVVVATLDSPLDLGALDGRKCDLIFLLASPDDGFTHLNLLGRLSLLLNEPNFADKLRASGSPTELFERLIQCEKHLVR